MYSADAGRVETTPGSELHFIHQDLALIGQLTAAENLALARGAGAAAFAPYGDRSRGDRARELIARFGPEFDVDIPVQALSPAQRAIVAISRARDGWIHSANVLFLDEPTESLHKNEVEVLFEAVRKLAAEGTGIVFVSHRLDEMLALSHRVVVLRDGRKVADGKVADIDESRLVHLIAAAEVEAEHRREAAEPGEVALDVRGLSGSNVANFGLRVRAGEVVGIAGVLGSGRETVPALLYGAVESEAERFRIAGKPYERRSPAESLRRGIVFAPADRAALGTVREMSARENLTLPHLQLVRGRFGHISPGAERARTAAVLNDFDVKPRNTEQRIALFSGGNQQKIVIARSLHNDPRLLLFDEPTQGVDVGAKASIYSAIARGAADGAAVVVSSSDAKELLAICDRVIVMRDGSAAASFEGDDLTEQQLIAAGYGLP
ncbi:MAG TPA: sugar ABC transporter ATP-binding protein [Candidatus Agrococcus pullicola]|uniref:Sugar ABC transporter ATP-binding protein n=1 Tax=Candidatus Agrococcus pullicola TaxID=2838429 RepID=A0A9D1YUN5_9MICO|nr:sugar ABC transporter ATP-binding protein [Candidatus Agrococcus pullicola]